MSKRKTIPTLEKYFQSSHNVDDESLISIPFSCIMLFIELVFWSKLFYQQG
jgi:hypothetical protein